MSAKNIILELHNTCGNTIASSMSEDRQAKLAPAYLFSNELNLWNTILSDRQENILLRVAEREYLVALLNLCQGQYRNAFKGLRLVLELSLQSVLLSVDIIGLREWLKGLHDTRWAAIVDDQTGVFSNRFCASFFPELTDIASNFGLMARTLYRELSECTHGNIGNAILVPESLEFNQKTFDLWLEKADTSKLIIHFALCVRYLAEISTEKREKLSEVILDSLDHISSIRILLGGAHHE